ncbi:MAG: hypothetical protein KDD60_12415, partial [Bdellovibrionales bacterium]|nr:hypothetical protein [Bdellovibrionales bacterium]
MQEFRSFNELAQHLQSSGSSSPSHKSTPVRSARRLSDNSRNVGVRVDLNEARLPFASLPSLALDTHVEHLIDAILAEQSGMRKISLLQLATEESTLIERGKDK